MHTGRFPAAPPACLASTPYEPASWSAVELDPPTSIPTSRRQWLLTVGGAVLGGAALTGAGLLSGRLRLGAADTATDPRVLANTAPMPDWAEQMLLVSDDELLRMAGEYERMSRQHVGDARLAPAFERVLQVAARSSGPAADAAAACAVRSLAKLDRVDIVQAWLGRLERTETLPEAALEARRMIDEAFPAWRRNKR